MARTVTTATQAGKISDLLVASLCKLKLPAGGVQRIIESQGGLLTDELIEVIRNRVNSISPPSDVIVRVVNIDISTRDALFYKTGCCKISGWKINIRDPIIGTIPNFAGGETTVTFFKPAKILTSGQLAEEYANRSLKPAHPSAVVKANKLNPFFPEQHQANATVWGDGLNHLNHIIFRPFIYEMFVTIFRSDAFYEWDGGWWFAGMPVN